MCTFSTLPFTLSLFTVSLTSFPGFTFITVSLQSAQTHWALRACVCVCFIYPHPLSALFSPASFFLFHQLMPLSSYLWMNERTIQHSARVVSKLVSVCVLLSRRTLSQTLCVCLYSCLNLTAAPVWVTDPAVSWLQYFYCLAARLISMLFLHSSSVCTHEAKRRLRMCTSSSFCRYTAWNAACVFWAFSLSFFFLKCERML